MSHPLPPISSLIRVECASHASVAGALDPTKPPPAFSTAWLSLSTLSYRYSHDPPSTYPRRWDVVSRTTSKASGADAVVILARLAVGDGPRILLVKQFRPPLAAVSVELPAGLVDAGERVEEAALRELREETGFVGRVRRCHRPASLSPGISAETVAMVEVDVTGRKEQQVDAGENIEVVSVPLERLEDALEFMEKEEGVVVKHAVGTLAAGIAMGARMVRGDA